ncbi:MAG: dihydrofolate reductase [Gemmataceae bacterium]|nr:dihydrofolate reductase [Gemmataceae bacterium]
MRVWLIAAMGTNRVIGDGERIPWHQPRDLKRFRALTMGKPLIMGRRTAESLGKPLPGRTNIVLTRGPAWGEGWITAATPEAALAAAPEAEEVMVIGGGEVYRLFLPLATRAYLTIIEGEFAGSATFPYEGVEGWTAVREERHPPDERNPWAERFIVLERG